MLVVHDLRSISQRIDMKVHWDAKTESERLLYRVHHWDTPSRGSFQTPEKPSLRLPLTPTHSPIRTLPCIGDSGEPQRSSLRMDTAHKETSSTVCIYSLHPDLGEEDAQQPTHHAAASRVYEHRHPSRRLATSKSIM